MLTAKRLVILFTSLSVALSMIAGIALGALLFSTREVVVTTVTVPHTLTQTVVQTATVERTVTTLSTHTVTYTLTTYIRNPAIYSLGEEFEVEMLRLTVINVTEARHIKALRVPGMIYEYYAPQPGLKLVVIYISIFNPTPSGIYLPRDLSFRLIADSRNTYLKASLESLVRLEQTSSDVVNTSVEHLDLSIYVYAKTVPPSSTVIASAVFQIPEEEKPAVLVIEWSGGIFLVNLEAYAQ